MNTMVKTTLREIRESLGRYMAILAIVALGVAFFVGLKVTKPSMLLSGSIYLEENNLYDLRLLSTVGFGEKDVKRLNGAEGVEIAEGAVSADFLAVEEDGSESVLRAHSLLWIQNQVVVRAGRKPQAADECVVDGMAFGRDAIGTTIRVSENNEEDVTDLLQYEEYRVVGICDASYYINYERGTTALGNGQLKGFVYIPQEGFDTDYYTEVFIRLKERYPLYSQDYEDYIEDAMDWAEPLCAELAEGRYETLLEDGRWQIEDGERELARQEAEAEERFADARRELTDAEAEIADAEAEIADGWEKIAEGRAEIAENRPDLEASLRELEDGRTEIADGLDQIADKRTEFSDMEGEEKDGLLGGLNLKEAQVKGKQAQVEAGLAQANMGKRQLQAAEEMIARQEEKLRDAEQELADAREEVADGWKEYEENRQEFLEEIADARQELADAREELEELEEPDTYVLGRDANIGYACYENDSDIVEEIADVFPVFFFLVAALVCMTTMARMVEEQRTQIGVLKALGYGKGAIIGKYLFYSGSAALLGGVIGFLAGSTIFPMVIWSAYRIMYRIGELKLVLYWKTGLLALLAAACCSMGTTLATCRYELGSVAAQLMRPRAPKSGKRIFLERIPWLWNRMKFLMKVSARNIFRYKQRFFMMVFGIGGCTGLLLTGFGIKDSIGSITVHQYEEIQLNDLSALFDKTYDRMDTAEFERCASEYTQGYTVVFEGSVDVEGSLGTKSATLVIPQRPEEIGAYLDLHTVGKEPLDWPQAGEVILTEKLAKKCGVTVGDRVTLEDEDYNKMEVTVSGICENYIFNYAYLSPDTWREQAGEEPDYKCAYLNVKEGEDTYAVSAAFMNCRGVASVTAYEDMETRFGSMIQSLDYVVALIIFCAGALAFIVLYNLTNINITERLREIATIKVLGFYRKETASYVFRENRLLTAIGILVGLIIGKYLHRFVMYKIDVESVAFDVHIAPMSVLYSIVLTFVFAGFVNRVMNRKLDDINMAESMKSIE